MAKKAWAKARAFLRSGAWDAFSSVGRGRQKLTRGDRLALKMDVGALLWAKPDYDSNSTIQAIAPMDLTDLKREIDLLSGRLGKTQDYL